MMDWFNKDFAEKRKNIRVRATEVLTWQLKNGALNGQARVCNISASGMLLEADFAAAPGNKSLFSFETALGHNNFIPQIGQLIWHKKKRFAKNVYQCGIKFVEPADFIRSKLHQKIQQAIRLTTSLRSRQRFIYSVLLLVLVAFVGCILWLSNQLFNNLFSTNEQMLRNSNQQAALTQSYAHRFQATELMLAGLRQELKSTKELYQQSAAMLSNVSNELQNTKTILAQTENMLIAARSGDSTLKGEIESISSLNQSQISSSKRELKKTIALLREKNNQLSQEMSSLNNQMSFYEGDIKNIEEGKALIVLYHQKLKAVKSKIKDFRREAHAAKQATLREKDRIKLLLGNNGFFIKDGQIVEVDESLYGSADLLGPSQFTESATPKRQVEIDVSFFE